MDRDKTNEIIESIDKYLEEVLFYYDLPGLAVAVGKENFVHRKVLGYSDFIKKEPLTEDKIFHMASVSKTFVSMGIMKLIQEKKLRLEEKVVNILPWIRIDDYRLRDITIKSLLTHTSGLADVDDYGWDRPRGDVEALRDYVMSKEVTESKLLWAPEENKLKYSNIGYEILGLVIAETSGVSFEEYMKESFLKPLEMNNSNFLTFERGLQVLKKEDNTKNYNIEECLGLDVLKKARMAMPHYKNEENHICLEKHYPYNREHGPSSTLTTNLYDIEKWAKAALNKTLVDDDLYKKIWAGHAIVPNNGEEMGLGWFIRNQDDKKLVGHEGTDDGFRASFWVCLQEDAYVIVMSNISKAPVKKISKGVFERICYN